MSFGNLLLNLYSWNQCHQVTKYLALSLPTDFLGIMWMKASTGCDWNFLLHVSLLWHPAPLGRMFRGPRWSEFIGTVTPFRQQGGCQEQGSARSAYYTSVDHARKEAANPGGFRWLISAHRKHNLWVHTGSLAPPPAHTHLAEAGHGRPRSMLHTSWVCVTTGEP